MRPSKKLPPWSHHHEPWCAVFRNKPCDCDDDDHRPRHGHRRLRGGSGGVVPPERKRELEDA
jgi:hypothetical protein